jgi:hypothetical protein
LFEVEREYKSFFKTTIEKVGTFKIIVSEKQFQLERASIVNKNE